MQLQDQEYLTYFEENPRPMWIYDPETFRILAVNNAAIALYGYSREEFLSMSLLDMRPISQVDRFLDSSSNSGVPRSESGPFKHRRKDGTVIDVNLRRTTIEFNERKACLAVLIDVTDERVSDRALQETQERFQTSETLRKALCEIAERSTILGKVQDLYAGIHQTVSGFMDARNFHVATYDEATQLLSFPYFVDQIAARPAPRPLGNGLTEHVLRTRMPVHAAPAVSQNFSSGDAGNAGTDWIDWLGVPLRSGDSVFGVLAVQSYDRNVVYTERDQQILAFVSQHISTAVQRVQTEQKLKYHTYYDPLTDLPNRLLFQDRFKQAFARTIRNNEMLGILFLNLDHFRRINESLGHRVGDRVLQLAAQRLSQRVRQCDTLARLGGDEFLWLISGVTNVEHTAMLAEDLLERLRAPFEIDGNEIHLTASIGISIYPLDGGDADVLMKNADIALNRVKENSRNNYQFYEPDMNIAVLKRLHLESRLRKALSLDQFDLHYQTQVDLQTGRVTGAEALLRWNVSPQESMLPSGFLPILEDSGLIISVGEWVLRTACKQMKRWEERTGRALTIAVNLSGRQFEDENLPTRVCSALEESGLEARLLELEITEGVLMKNPARAVRISRQLRQLGVRLCIDDFGTGYSSLSYLKRFPVHTLKIDRSFVRDTARKRTDRAIVSTVITLAHRLNLEVVAEGVELAGQAEFLRSRRCDKAQGYFYNRPLPVDRFELMFPR